MTDTMAKGALRHWGPALLLGLAGLGVAGFLLTAKPRPAPAPAPAARPPLVQFVSARPGVRRLPVTTQGTVQAEREVTLTSQVAGRVMAVSDGFVAGGVFAAGERLLQIDTADYDLAIARAQFQVAAARQRLAEEEGRALQARRQWRDLGADQANALFLREPQLAAARADLTAAQAARRVAELNLQRTALRLPFPGRLISKSADVGQYVGVGAAVARVYATDRVRVRLPVTERQLARLDLPLGRAPDSAGAQSARPAVTLSAVFAGQRWEWPGRIERTEARIDTDTRVLYAVALVDEPFAGDASRRPPLLPGLFVQARIEGRRIDKLTPLPRSAWRGDGTVLLVDANQRLLARKAPLLHADAQRAWVFGLAPGDRVVVNGAALRAGMSVTAVPARPWAQEAF